MSEVCVCVCTCVRACSVLSDSATLCTLVLQASLSMEFPRQKYWVCYHFLLQGIFLTQGSNPGLLHCRQILYCLSLFINIVINKLNIIIIIFIYIVNLRVLIFFFVNRILPVKAHVGELMILKPWVNKI